MSRYLRRNSICRRQTLSKKLYAFEVPCQAAAELAGFEFMDVEGVTRAVPGTACDFAVRRGEHNHTIITHDTPELTDNRIEIRDMLDRLEASHKSESRRRKGEAREVTAYNSQGCVPARRRHGFGGKVDSHDGSACGGGKERGTEARPATGIEDASVSHQLAGEAIATDMVSPEWISWIRRQPFDRARRVQPTKAETRNRTRVSILLLYRPKGAHLAHDYASLTAHTFAANAALAAARELSQRCDGLRSDPSPRRGAGDGAG